MFPEKPARPRESLASSDEHNILPDEHIITPEVIDDNTPDEQTTEPKELPSPDTTSSVYDDTNNENRNEEAINRFNLRKNNNKAC